MRPVRFVVDCRWVWRLAEVCAWEGWQCRAEEEEGMNGERRGLGGGGDA